jgi:amino acid permease
MATGDTRNAPLGLTIALAVLALAFAVVGVIYVTHTADTLPSVFPGHQAGSLHHHVKHAIATFGLAVGCGLGAWLTSGRRSAPPDATV